MTTSLFLALALALSAVTVLPAQPPGPPPFDVMRNLDLTEAQRQSIRTILEGRRAATMAKRDTLGAREMTLMEAMTEPATTEARLRELHEATSEARLALLFDEREVMLELQAVLTPAQLAKAKEQRLKFRAAMEAHRVAMDELGAGGPGGPPRP